MGLYMPAHGLCLPSISGFVSRRSCRACSPLLSSLSLSVSLCASLPRTILGNRGAILSTNSLRMLLCGFVVVIVGSMMCSWLSQQCVFCFHVVEDFLWKLCGMCVHQDQLRFKVCGYIHWRGSFFRSFWCSCSEKQVLGLLIFSLSKSVCSRVGIEEKRREEKVWEGGREGLCGR
jgi:hypothetical protein